MKHALLRFFFVLTLNAQAGDLLIGSNPGAEQDSLESWTITTTPNGGTLDNGGESKISISDIQDHVSEGEFSFYLNGGSSTTNVTMTNQTRLEIRANTEYRLSFDLKGRSGSLSRFHLSYQFYVSETGSSNYGGRGSWDPEGNQFNYYLVSLKPLSNGFTGYTFQVFQPFFGSDNDPADVAYLELSFWTGGDQFGTSSFNLDNICLWEANDIITPSNIEIFTGESFGQYFSQIEWHTLGTYTYSVEGSHDLKKWDLLEVIGGDWDGARYFEFTENRPEKRFYRISVQRK